jgi:hypothetical protein
MHYFITTVLPGPQYNQARPSIEREEPPSEGTSEEQGDDDNPEIAWAKVWFEQGGRNLPKLIPREYAPCKFRFASERGCRMAAEGKECVWSHSEIFKNPRYRALIDENYQEDGIRKLQRRGRELQEKRSRRSS